MNLNLYAYFKDGYKEGYRQGYQAVIQELITLKYINIAKKISKKYKEGNFDELRCF